MEPEAEGTQTDPCMSVLGSNLRARRNVPVGTSSIWWWGHPSPEALTELQHLENAAFHLQEVLHELQEQGPGSKLPCPQMVVSTSNPSGICWQLEAWIPVGRCNSPREEQRQRSPALRS